MEQSNKKEKVALGLSGGVDSSVGATLLLEAGYDVTGVFMECWREPGCRTDEDRADALAVAMKLGIQFVSLDFKDAYRERVWNYFVSEYEVGRVPNPDVICNREVKFGLFYEWAIERGFDKVATGHYAKILDREKSGEEIEKMAPAGKKEEKNFYLVVPRDEWKDQTYFLNQIEQESLSRILFPLGDLEKREVRKIAGERGLEMVANKKDSTGVCFVGEINVGRFLREKMGEKQGSILDMKGKKIGEHRGVWFYTIGQRGGLEIAVQNPNSKPYYVVSKNVEENVIVVGFEEDLWWSDLRVLAVNRLVNDDDWQSARSGKMWLRIRHTGDLIEVENLEEKEVKKDTNIEKSWRVKLRKPVKGINEGQFAVLYGDGESLGLEKGEKVCLGGGVFGE